LNFEFYLVFQRCVSQFGELENGTPFQISKINSPELTLPPTPPQSTNKPYKLTTQIIIIKSKKKKVKYKIKCNTLLQNLRACSLEFLFYLGKL